MPKKESPAKKVTPFTGAPDGWVRAVFDVGKLMGRAAVGDAMPRVGLAHATMRRLRIAVGEPLLVLSAASARPEAGFVEVSSGEEVLRSAAEVGRVGGCVTLAAAWPSASAQAGMALLDDATMASLAAADPDASLSTERVWVARAHALLPSVPTAHRVVLALDGDGEDAGLGELGVGEGGIGPATAISLASQLKGRWVTDGTRVSLSLNGRRLPFRITALSRRTAPVELSALEASPEAVLSESGGPEAGAFHLARRDGGDGAGHDSGQDRVSCPPAGALAVVSRDVILSFATVRDVPGLDSGRDRGDLTINSGYSGRDSRGFVGAKGGARGEKEALGRVLESVGGVDGPASALLQALRAALVDRDAFLAMGVEPPKGVLLFGPPGTGKTLLAKAACQALGVEMLAVDAARLVGGLYGDSERQVRNLFAQAASHPAAVIFLDEIDAVMGASAGGGAGAGEMEARLKASLLQALDSLGTDGSGGRVVVIAATNRPEELDAGLRHRLHLQVEVGVPSADARLAILSLLLRDVPHNLLEKDVGKIAAGLHGFVGADVSLLVSTAVAAALRRAEALGSSVEVSHEDLRGARAAVGPSALRETVVEVPKVLWTDIGGQEEAKAALAEAVEWPLKYPEQFARLGIRPPAGVLLYGPPGCSKTLLAKALATESSLNFLAVKGPELLRKYVGDSEKAVAAVFRKARQAAPSVIFFDEIDALAGHRAGGAGGASSAGQRVVAQLLSEMDGIEPLKQVIVMAATNRPDLIDAAFLRPGRIDRLVYVAPPDLPSREAILQIHLARMPLAPDVDIAPLAARSQGFSGAELAHLCREAALQAMGRDETLVSAAALEGALDACTPRITQEMLDFYQGFAAKQRA